MKKRLLPVVTRFTTAILSSLIVGSCLIYGANYLDLAPIEQRASAEAADTAKRDASKTAARLPLDFVENRGQWDAAIKFVASKGAMVAAFERDAIRLHFGRDRPTRLALAFVGASKDAGLAGEAKRSSYYNFYNGNDPAKWRRDVAAYSSLLYRELYEGITVRVREDEGQLEYDLILAAGADLEKVVIRADGASGLEISDDGALLLRTGAGTLRQAPPQTWEELPNGEKRAIECRFRLLGAHRYGFEVPGRNRSLPLVIDPGLEWSTYLGGSKQEEIYDLAAAGDGTEDVIAVGATMSPDFSGRATAVAGFVARFNASGVLIYNTILNGSDREWIRGLDVNSSGEPVVVGESYSSDYPVTPGAYDTTHGFGSDGRPGADAFITRLGATGNILSSTFLGTNEYELAMTVALAPTGAVIVGGETASPTWPTTPGAYDRTYNCCSPFGAGNFSITDAFVARLNANLSALEYSTYFGGNGDEVPMNIVVDAQGFVTFTGLTYSPPSGPAMPTTANALRRTPASDSFSADALLVRMKLDGGGAADLRYSTFLGGNDTDEGYAIALDPATPEIVVLGGLTYSTVSAIRFPTTPGTLRPSSQSVDGYLMKFQFPASGGASLVWSTLFGGFLYEEVSDLAFDSTGAIVIAGQTESFDLPTTQGAYDRSVAISNGLLFFDAYVARISADGAQLLYGSYLGGRFDDWHVNLALVGDSSAVVSGWTQSNDFPTTPSAHDSLLNNDGVGAVSVPTDGFLSRLRLRPDGDGDDAVAAPTLLSPPNGAPVSTNTLITFDWTDVADPSGLDGYHVQLNRRPDFVCCDDWQEVWIEPSEWLASVRFDGPYYWRVQTADRSGNLSEWSEVRTLNAGLGLSGFFINPASVEGGNNTQGQVMLTASAPAGGAAITLSSSNTAAARVPASVTIAAGSNVATFTVTTSAVSAPATVNINASYRGTSKSATVTVTPRTAPPPAPSLVGPANGTQLPPNQGITFSWNAVAGAATYEIQVDNSSGFSNPLVVSLSGITQTQSVHSFSAERRHWWRVRGRTAGGTAGAWSSVRSFEIRRGSPPPPPPPGPAALSTLTLNPSSVTGGNSSQGTVTLTSAAPSGGALVTLSGNNTAAATVPASVTVAAGATSATFTVTTRSVTASTPVTINASYGGVTRTATLTVRPQAPPPSTDTVSIQSAEYSSGNRQLRVEASSSNSSATLTVQVTSTGAQIGTLRNEGGGRYRGDFSVSSNPQNITVRSSLGGSATRAVSLK